jgi:hypothetical protein
VVVEVGDPWGGDAEFEMKRCAETGEKGPEGDSSCSDEEGGDETGEPTGAGAGEGEGDDEAEKGENAAEDPESMMVAVCEPAGVSGVTMIGETAAAASFLLRHGGECAEEEAAAAAASADEGRTTWSPL